MEAIDLIMNALITGTALGVKDVAADTVKDMREKLKKLLQSNFAQKPNSEVANNTLARYEQEPDKWQEQMREVLVDHEVGQESEIIEAAKHILTLVNPQQAAMGKYNAQITGPVEGFVQGDHANVSMTFGEHTIRKNLLDE
jgi:flagellar biosynthesis/type III secretory pathway protein FliH